MDCQVLKGEIFYWLGQYSEALEIFEHAHQESQRIGTVTQTFDSLIWKLCTLANLEETDHFHKEIVVAEELFKSLPKESSKEFDRRKVLYNWVKGVESILRYEFRKGVEINMVNLGLIRHCIHSMHHDGFL